MRPLGEVAAGEHGWHLVGGHMGRMVFGPLPVAGAKRQTYEPIAPVREETAQQVVVAEVFTESSKNIAPEPDAPTAAASALLRKAREADDARARRRMIDPWRNA